MCVSVFNPSLCVRLFCVLAVAKLPLVQHAGTRQLRAESSRLAALWWIT